MACDSVICGPGALPPVNGRAAIASVAMVPVTGGSGTAGAVCTGWRPGRGWPLTGSTVPGGGVLVAGGVCVRGGVAGGVCGRAGWGRAGWGRVVAGGAGWRGVAWAPATAGISARLSAAAAARVGTVIEFLRWPSAARPASAR
jgi:hypothetical protein